MLRKFWKRAPPSPPSPEQSTQDLGLELSDDDLEKVAGGLERAFPFVDNNDPAPGSK